MFTHSMPQLSEQPSPRRVQTLLLVSLLAVSMVPVAAPSAFAASEEAAGDASADAAKPAPRRFTRVIAPNGIKIRRWNKTNGQQPGKTDTVVVHYHGTLEDGTVFDSSVKRRQPATFALNRVIPCWTEAVSLLHVGEKAEVTCPGATAYGSRGSPPKIPPNATLIFEIELLGVR